MLAEPRASTCILVGDSAAMVVLGHDSTVQITVDEMVVLTRAVSRSVQRRARRRRHAVRIVPGLGRGSGPQRGPLDQGGRRGRGQARGRRADADARRRDRRRRHPSDGPRRSDAAVGRVARRLSRPGPHASATRCACADERARSSGRLLRRRPRSDAGRVAAHITGRSRFRRSASAPARNATARFSSGTTPRTHDRHVPQFVKRYADLGGAAQERARELRLGRPLAKVPRSRAHLSHGRGRGTAVRAAGRQP